MASQGKRINIKVTDNIDYFEMLLDKKKDGSGNLHLDNEDLKKIKAAYDSAHDIRKFEIGLYWQRTTYVWGFISLLIAGYGYSFVHFFDPATPEPNRTIYCTLMLITSLIGLTFTGSWRQMLQSSKFWQENWELSIAVLEKYITGNLHKIHFHRYKNPYDRSSVHKIMLSLMARFFTVWFILLLGSVLCFINQGVNLIDFKTEVGLIIVKISIYILALVYPIFEVYNMLTIWKKGGENQQRSLTALDIYIVHDEIKVEHFRQNYSE